MEHTFRAPDGGEITYSKPRVKLIGEDGNAFAIMGSVKKALKKAQGQDAVDAYLVEAMAGDYDNLLTVTMMWVEAE